jgi:hypothetical protein
MRSFIGPQTTIRATQIQTQSEIRRPVSGLSTFEEERQEVLASVLHSLATETPDIDRTAACFHLLRHLTSPASVTACRH